MRRGSRTGDHMGLPSASSSRSVSPACSFRSSHTSPSMQRHTHNGFCIEDYKDAGAFGLSNLNQFSFAESSMSSEEATITSSPRQAIILEATKKLVRSDSTTSQKSKDESPRPPQLERQVSSINRKIAAARRGSVSSRRGSISIRSEEVIQEKKGPNVESVLFDVMKAYMSLELELADESQVMQLAGALRVNTSVTSINLSYNASIRDAGLQALSEALEHNTTLASLNLSGCTGFSDAAAAQMLAVLDKVFTLRTLTLAGCLFVGDQFAAQLAESMDVESLDSAENGGLQLQEVSLSSCRALTDEGVLDIGRALAHSVALKVLNLQGCVLLTDRAVVALADGLKCNPALEVLNLSWCEELTDESAFTLAEVFSENRFLTKLMLSCCIQMTDAAGKALAAGLENNRSITSIDLSWVTQLGEPTVQAFTQALSKNRTLTALNLSGCKCMNQLAVAASRNVEEDPSGSSDMLGRSDSPASGPSFARGPSDTDSFAHKKDESFNTFKRRSARASAEKNAPSLAVLLQRNRDRPVVHKTLANSALAGSSNGKDLAPGQLAHGRRGLITSPVELLRTLRAAIINGAALYNAEDAEGCFNIFTQTAESVVASTRSPLIADAMMKVNSIYAPREMPQKIWLLRSAFDALVDELTDEGIEG
jgi:hypothetical protein